MRSTEILYVLLLPLLMLVVLGCGLRGSNVIEEYNDFGVRSARMGLWGEAILRWKRVVEMDTENHQAHNNLGVAYESSGEFEAALAEYEAAVRLDPDNKVYRSNYSRFKRNYERTRKRSEADKDSETDGKRDSESAPL